MSEQPPESTPPPAPPVPGPGPAPTGLDAVFARLRGMGLNRTRDTWIVGVCSGIAARLGIDPIIVRAAFFVLTIFGGIGVSVYALLWLIMPAPDGSLMLERALRRGQAGPLVLMAVIVLGALSAFSDRQWIPMTLALVVMAVVVLVAARRTNQTPVEVVRSVAQRMSSSSGTGAAATPHGMGPGRTGGIQDAPYPTQPGQPGQLGQTGQSQPAQPPANPQPPTAAKTRRPAAGAIGFMVTVGAALIGYAIGSRFGGPEAQLVGFAGALGAVGLCLVGIGLAGRRVGVAGLPVWVLIIALVSTNGHSTDLHSGDEVWTISGPAAVTKSLGAGDATLDLHGLTAADAQGQTITATVKLGQLTIVRPDPSVPVIIHAGASMGGIELPGAKESGGIAIQETVTSGPTATSNAIIVRANVSLGAIVVKDAS